MPNKKRFLEVLPLLITNLRDELQKIEALHTCLVREKEILCGGSPESLLESNSVKEQILTDLEATRSLRTPILMELSTLSGVPSDQISVNAIASLATGPARRELLTLRQGLGLLAGKIQTLNARNRGSSKTPPVCQGLAHISPECRHSRSLLRQIGGRPPGRA